MSTWLENLKTKITRRFLLPVLALAMAVSVGVYQVAKPANAAGPAPAAAAAPLDNHRLGAPLSHDQAREALAARVTPAIVNVTVTSKTNVKMSDEDWPDMRQFGPFGRSFAIPMQPQSRIGHGLGRRVVFCP